MPNPSSRAATRPDRGSSARSPRSPLRPGLLGLVVGLVCVAFAVPAFAQATVDCSTGITFSSNTTLTADYVFYANTSSAACITLTNGADLDLAGHTIRCDRDPAAGRFCNAAVVATKQGSVVRNTSPMGGGITSADPEAGPVWTPIWTEGVVDAQEVRDLSVGYAIVGVSSDDHTRKVHGNVVRQVETCVDVALEANTSFVRDNFCATELETNFTGPLDRVGIRAVGTGSGNGPKIEYNLVTAHAIGVYGDSGNLRIQHNVVCAPENDAGISVAGAAGSTFTGNVCCPGVALDAAPYCEPLTPPFVMP